MIRIFLTILTLILAATYTQAQSLHLFADSIRRTYHIPELCYAVISSDSIIDIAFIGTRKIGTTLTARPEDRFRIGSNTKAITAFIAGQLVHDGKVKWDTKFFDILPELKAKSDPAYYDMTLLDLLTFRVPFPSYTYTDALPGRKQIEIKKGTIQYNFVRYFLRHAIHEKKDIYRSNVSYSAAGLMMERITGRSYIDLVQGFGTSLGINFSFGSPNRYDTTQVWGHGMYGVPEPPYNFYKLDWLLSAGNINVTLPDYIKFIQLQLRGLHGRSDMLSEKEFNFLHYGKPEFALGWFTDTTKEGHIISRNLGNPGTFTTTVHIIKDIDHAYIIFTNIQNKETYEAIDILLDEMKRRYGY